MRRQPSIVTYDLSELHEINNRSGSNNNEDEDGGGGIKPRSGGIAGGGGAGRGGEGGGGGGGGVTFEESFEVVVTDSGNVRKLDGRGRRGKDIKYDDGPGKKMTLKKPLEVQKNITSN